MFRRGPLRDLLAVAVLVSLAWWALGYLVRDDLFIFADNPGSYVRLWWLLDIVQPRGGSILDWNPFWYAGWPEWQYYPPSYGLAGLAIKALTFGHLSSVFIYQLLLFLSYLVPAIVAFFALSRLGFGRWVGFAAGIGWLIFTDLYGGVGGVMIGMLGDRPALGLAPLAWAIGVWAAGSRRPAVPTALLALTLGAMVLLHPFRLLLPAVLIPVSVLLVDRRRWSRLLVTYLPAMVLALGLAGWWLVPYLARSDAATPVLRAGFDTLGFWLLGGRLPFFLIFAAWALVRAAGAPPRERALILALALAPLAILSFMVVNWLVLVDRLGVAALDPIRFIEDVYLPVILLAAIGFVDLVRSAFERSRTVEPVWLGRLLAGGATILLAGLAVQPFPKWLEYYQPRPGAEPRFLSDATRDYRLNGLWDVLRANPNGRVLFTSSVFRLRQTGENVPSYLMALAPVFTGRETIGGTFQHWAPIATYYWHGDNPPAIMRDRTDLKDDQTLFGLPWRQMDDTKLVAALRALDVSDVVASDYDLWTRTYLDRSPSFRAVYNDPQYVVYRVTAYTPSIVESAAEIRAAESSDGYDLRVSRSAAGTEALLKVTYSPRWTATSPAGPVAIDRQPNGLMRLRLPEGSDYVVALRYEPAGAEQLGSLVTLLAAAIVTVLLLSPLAGRLGRTMPRVAETRS